MGKSRKRDCITFLVMFMITVVAMLWSIVTFTKSFIDGDETTFRYNENSELNYKVKLLENNFYEKDYLTEDYDLVASSIDKIEVDFKYLFGASDYFTGKYNRKINANIIAYQKGDNTKKKIWDYHEDIGTEKIGTYDKDILQLMDNDKFVIDYQKYRKLMDEYKKNYGVSLVGDLVVNVKIGANLNYGGFKDEIKIDSRSLGITVSLTDQIVNIKKDIIKDNSQTLVEKEDSTINYIKLALSVLAFVIGLILCIFMGITLVRIVGIDSKYVKELNKIFRAYGSIIVNVKNVEIDDNANIMYVTSFEELLDAQQELRKPILYCNIKKNVESLFLIKYDNDVIVYRMHSDLYNKKKK